MASTYDPFNAIRLNFAEFEKNIFNDVGNKALEDALDKVIEILDNPENKYNCKIARNFVGLYQRKVTKDINKVFLKGTPDSEILGNMYKVFSIFENYGFDADPEFQDISSTVEDHLLDSLFVEYLGGTTLI